MTMDWSRERYVRLYTRDTGTWALLSWQARCVLPLLMRKLDRAGKLSIPGQAKPEAVVAKLLDVPVRVVKPALEDLAGAGIVELTTSGLAMPNFAEAQEAIAPSTERVRRHRERANSKAANGGTLQKHDGNASVSGETPSRAEPSLAVLSRAVPSPLPPEGNTWGEVAQVCDRLPWLHPDGLPALLSPRDRIHRLVVAGASASEICRVLEGFATAVLAGKEKREHWNAQYVFSGHFDRLRIAYGSGSAPEAETPQQTLARVKENLARLKGAS